MSLPHVIFAQMLKNREFNSKGQADGLNCGGLHNVSCSPFARRNGETISDKHSAADGFKSVPPYHYKSCIRKRRRRFNLENNKPCAKYRREVNKSEENSAGGMCPAFGPDKNLYAQVELGRRGSLFWSCKNTKSKRRGQNKVSTNTRGASSLQ